jgi:hypothetical protein
MSYMLSCSNTMNAQADPTCRLPYRCPVLERVVNPLNRIFLHAY